MGTLSWDHRSNPGLRHAGKGSHGNAEPRPERPHEWSEDDFAEFNEGVQRARAAYERKAKS